MDSSINHLEDLRTLNLISETLNRAKDTTSAISTALGALVPLMGLETGWISLLDHESGQFRLAAHINLPPELHPDNRSVWEQDCTCQKLSLEKKLDSAYSEVHCSRLAKLDDASRYLSVHASTPLLSGNLLMGILNVAAGDWSAFDTRSLTLLSGVGKQIGVALERARLYDRLREKRDNEQISLLDFSRQLLARSGLDELTHYLTQETVALLDSDASALLLHSEDGEELLFAAAHGWRQDPVKNKRRIPLHNGSGAEWAMVHQKNLLVTDLEQETQTYWSSGWVESEGFRSHAIVPLIVEDRSIGALVINNREPRLLESDELQLLQLMSSQAALAIDSARLLAGRNRKHQLEKELAIGQQIQISLLPATLPTIPGYEFGMLYQPEREVGGDFYDFCQGVGDNSGLCIFIGDVSGKGIPAAMFMAMCRTHIRSSILGKRNPASALARANEMILNDSQNGLFLSVLAASLDPLAHKLIFANAGHDRPLILRKATGEVEVLKSRGIILGAFEEISLEEKTTRIHPGDSVIFFTDGIKDALSEEDEPFGLERLHTVVANQLGLSAKQIVAAIKESLAEYTGTAAQTDDLTLLVLQRTE